MAARREITKKYAREYQRATKKDKGRMLDELCGATGWSRANARRAIATATKRKGRAGAVVRKPRARTYGYDCLKVLIRVWTLMGEPCGKYLAPIMASSLAQLYTHGELDEVADRLTDQVWDQLVAMSPATIDRLLKPTKKATGWTTTKAGRTTRVYDAPKTPLARLRETSALTDEKNHELQMLYERTNPAELTRNINRIQQELIASAADKTTAITDQAS